MSTPYRERLTVPLRWWVQMTMFLATIWLAVVVSMPAWLAWTTFGGCCAIAIAFLLWIGSPRVEVLDGQLQAGRARIPVRLLGTPTALDAEATKRALGIEADARAYLLTRPYLKQAARIPVLDPADPAPYWLVASRHPERLVAAIVAAGS